MKYLIAIDVQNDFISGSLGTKEAQEMYTRLLSKVKNFNGAIIMTQDTHYDNYLETQEGKLLPVAHCIKNSEGWRLPKELEELRKERSIKTFEKNTFGSQELVEYLKDKAVDSIELVGLCTDICVISNALMLKAAFPELPIYVDSACTAGVTPEKHREALDVMKSCQILVL